MTLWDALKFEIFQVQEPELAAEALNVLVEISKKLSSGDADALSIYLKPIIKECNENVEDAPTKQSQAASQILRHLAAASPHSCNLLVKGVVPHLLILYQTSDNVAKRRSLAEYLSEIFQANSETFGQWSGSPIAKAEASDSEMSADTECSLSKFSGEAFSLLKTSFVSAPVNEVSFRLTTLDALLQLAKVRSLLEDDKFVVMIKALTDVIITEESHGRDELKEAVINGIVDLAHQKPQLVIDSAFPAFLAKLPDKDTESPQVFIPILEAFAKLGSEPKVFEIVVLRLKNRIDAAVMAQASSAYIGGLLSALLYAFSHAKDNSLSANLWKYSQELVALLIQRIAVDLEPESQTDTLFYLVGRLSNQIIRSLPEESQQPISGEVFSLYLGQPVEQAPPFNMECTATVGRRNIISTFMVASLRKNIMPFQPAQDLILALAKFAITDTVSIGTRVATLQQLSLTINKFVPASQLTQALDPILHGSVDLLSPSRLNSTTIRVFFAIFKGLILRNAAITEELLLHPIEGLSDTQHGRVVAHGFSTILQPDEILTKENYCTISALHKQKTFILLVPKIAERFRKAEPPVRSNYLVALAGILRWLPFSILEPQLETLIPLLLQTLDISDEEDVKAGTIDTLTAILLASSKSLEEHASSLITRLLNNSSVSKTPSARVRLEALKCLGLVSSQMRREVVVPFQRQVVKRLVAALDDGKRAVRTEAVKCRSKWIDVDAVVDDDE